MRIDWQRLIPGFWFQNYPTDWDWDAALNGALDRHEPVMGFCTAKVGGFTVWVANWPYAYGSPTTKSGARDIPILPSVATRKRLRRAIILAHIKGGCESHDA